MPSSFATFATWPPDSSTRRTASALNSAVNRRRGRRSPDPDMDTRIRAHAHKVGVRQTGGTSVGYAVIDALDAQLLPLRAEIARFAAHQKACKTLVERLYGVGPLTSVAMWSELGDCTRFARSDQVVRHAGLDVTVYSSNDHRSGGRLSRQGPGSRCWPVYEPGK